MSFKKISFFLAFMLGAHLSILAQRMIPDEVLINYSCQQKPLRAILFDLSELSGVSIAWQDQIIPSDSIIDLSVRDEKLGRVLNHLIVPHQLKYKIVGNQLSIVKDKLIGADNKITFSGFVRDAKSGEALIDAQLYTFDNSVTSFTNNFGFYSLTLPKGLQRLYVSYLGYDRYIVELNLERDTTVDIHMESTNYLKEIVITELKIRPLDKNENELVSVNNLPMSRIKNSLPLAGEPDIIRGAMATAGVTSGADGFGGWSVRGGSENQNLILFDGIPVYGAQHAFGLFSIFNSDVIKSANLYKGTIPAHYSGRLSSILDIRTRDGNYKHLQGNVSVGLFTAKASLEGPVIKDKASFLVSARRTFVDPWLGAATEALNRRIDKEGRTDFYFYDLNAKLNFSLGRNSKLYLSYYNGDDAFESDVTSRSTEDQFSFLDKKEVEWNTGNALASVRWNWRISHKLFVNASAYYSDYRFETFDQDRVEIRNASDNSFQSAVFDAGYYQSQITNRGSRVEFDYIPNLHQSIKFGGAYVQHQFNPALVLESDRDAAGSTEQELTKQDLINSLDDQELKADEYEFFVSNEFKWGSHTRLNLGYNHLFIKTQTQNHHIPQPRILFSTGSDNYTFKASWGRAGQFLHSLVNTGLGVPIEVWLPSTDVLSPESSWMISKGHFFKTSSLGIIGVEFFLKEMQNLTRYGNSELIDISSGSNWEAQLPIGEGRAYGVETSINKSIGKTRFNLAYTLSWADRQFDELNNGERFRFRFDRRHVLYCSVVHQISPDIDFAVNWQYASGTPVTMPSGLRYFDYSEEGTDPTLVLIYDGINNASLPDYHRLDFGFNFRNRYSWGSSVLTLGLYNAYNRQNAFYRDVIIDVSDPNNAIRFEDVTVLPVLPTISYSISF